MKVAVIGSGLSAIAAIKTLIERGIKPIVLDYGLTLNQEKQQIVTQLSQLDPDNWNSGQREALVSNPTVLGKQSIPTKLAFGSDYFYGRSIEHAKTVGMDALPPFSFAKGGLSAGWGATVLPPSDCDLQDWPLKSRGLEKHFKKVLSRLPYSATNDELSKHFPLYSDIAQSIKLTRGNAELLNRLRNAKKLCRQSIAFGQSRMLIRSQDNNNEPGCKYCGYCMSGCVYGCIFKANRDLDSLVASDKINYERGVLVNSLKEIDNKVTIFYHDSHGSLKNLTVDRVFLAAGAVNSTRIVMQSRKLYRQQIRLLSTAGFITPMASLKLLPRDWPNSNTTSGIFLEYKVGELSDHWIHTQLSTPNELVYQKLAIKPSGSGSIQAIKSYLSQHLVIAHCNMHSDHSDGYLLSLEQGNSSVEDKLITRHELKNDSFNVRKLASRKLNSIARQIGCYALAPIIRNGPGGYHVGGTLPMTAIPEKETDTNLLGNPMGWNRIHVIDSSIFPSIPGTTVGLLAMANASRIASETNLN